VPSYGGVDPFSVSVIVTDAEGRTATKTITRP
jgi:hypothetical protein